MRLSNIIRASFFAVIICGNPVLAQTPWDAIFDGRRPAGAQDAPSLRLPHRGGQEDGDLSGMRPRSFLSGSPADVPPVGESSAVSVRRGGRSRLLGFDDPLADSAPCAVLDRAFFRPPSREEAVRMLEACMQAVSQRYGAEVFAAEGNVRSGQRETQGILLSVGGDEAASLAAQEALRASLALRDSKLFGHPAQVVLRDPAPAAGGRLSALQPIVDQVESSRAQTVVRSVRDVRDFVRTYGAALRQARNLNIADVAAHPTRQWAVMVYTRGEVNQDLNGYVEVNRDSERVRIQVETRLHAEGAPERRLPPPDPFNPKA